eukprot:jgi/Chrzof1/3550/Cz13g00020.t1
MEHILPNNQRFAPSPLPLLVPANDQSPPHPSPPTSPAAAVTAAPRSTTRPAAQAAHQKIKEQLQQPSDVEDEDSTTGLDENQGGPADEVMEDEQSKQAGGGGATDAVNGHQPVRKQKSSKRVRKLEPEYYWCN